MEVDIPANLTCMDLTNATGQLCLGLDASPSSLSITLLSIFLGLMTVCGAVGNVLVILSVALTRKLRTVTNCFIVSLAVADLLVAVFVMPISAFVEITGEWWFGPLVCWIFISADVFLCTSSIWNLLIISLERCMAISWPLWYGARRTRRLALYLIAVAWIVSMIICLPSLLLQGNLEGWMLENSVENEQCSYAIDEGYRIYSASGSFWIPLAIILFCYVRIFYVANRKDKLLQQKLQNGKVAVGGTSGGEFPKRPSDPPTSSDSVNELSFRHITTPSGMPMKHAVLVRASSIRETHLTSTTALIEIRMEEVSDPFSSNSLTTTNGTVNNNNGVNGHVCKSERKKISETRGNRRKWRAMHTVNHSNANGSISKKQLSFKDRERKVFKVLLIILCSFVACWMGFFVIYTLEPFCSACKNIDKRVYAFFLWLGYFNSMLNPLIYAGFSQEFRNAFCHILCCMCLWKKGKKKLGASGGIRPRRLVVLGPRHGTVKKECA